jgi:hypothetical protein
LIGTMVFSAPDITAEPGRKIVTGLSKWSTP